LQPDPSHTTVRTGPYTAVRSVVCTQSRAIETEQSQLIPKRCRQGGVEYLSAARTPGTVKPPDRVDRLVPWHTQSPQVTIPGRPPFPVAPGNGSQSPPNPTVQIPQLPRRFAEAEVPNPSPKVLGEIRYHPLRVHPAPAPRQFPYPGSKPTQRFVSDPPLRLSSLDDREPQELSPAGPVHRALIRVDLQLEPPCDEVAHATHHSLPRSLTANVDVAVSSAGESHPHALSEPYLNLSAHTAPAMEPRRTLVCQCANSFGSRREMRATQCVALRK